MRLCNSSILIFTCLSCLSFYPNRVTATTPNSTPTQLAQARAVSPVKRTVLKLGNRGSGVRMLQTRLKKLKYYSGAVDGRYGLSTQTAVIKFQKAQGLKRVDGIADLATVRSLQAVSEIKNQFVPAPIFTPTSTPLTTPQSNVQPKSTRRGFVWWSLLSIGILGSTGALIYLMRWLGQVKKVQKTKTVDSEAFSDAHQNSLTPLSQQSDTTPNLRENKISPASLPPAPSPNLHENTISPASLPPVSTQLLSPEKTSRLTKLNIVDELIKDLRSSDSIKRRKAIWDLGQQGDSRAIQPLVDLMIDADSQQVSLILAALAEIGVRTLKPMNRALAISMQDESPQVRQNAIRDLTRVYDMMGQMSQMLRHALEDPDADVQATARYALTQMNRLRSLPPSEETQDKQ
ncbi:MAG: peptidoglycan-binding protein [Desmonostoc vinosum HA7617-LM4]|nr:peptidoglycan-binding protein [Desmonostoc vinosum HA7617-LM4]